MTLVSFEEILLTVSGMAMKGCLFFGELPAWLAETGFGNKVCHVIIFIALLVL